MRQSASNVKHNQTVTTSIPELNRDSLQSLPVQRMTSVITCCFMQALELLAQLAKSPAGQAQPLWYADTAMAASSAASYLIDLLQMRVAHLSPLAVTSPQAFLQACSGQALPSLRTLLCEQYLSSAHGQLESMHALTVPPCMHSHSARPSLHCSALHLKAKSWADAIGLSSGVKNGCHTVAVEVTDKFEWCGSEYDVADLKGALVLLLAPGTPSDQLLAHAYIDPWAQDSWAVLSDPAQLLLKDLSRSQTAFNTHVSPPVTLSLYIIFQPCLFSC